MFLKKKWCGTIKGHGCADRQKQRAYITKEESTSPTISMEAMFLTAIVEAWDYRKVAVLDVLGAFMQVDMDELVMFGSKEKWLSSCWKLTTTYTQVM